MERSLIAGVILALLVAARPLPAAAQTDFAAERARMLQTVQAHAKQASDALGRDFIAPQILDVMRDVPRHEFVPVEARGDAYADRPLPIGHGATISQPFIVALMTDLLRVRRDDIVLEVGTGSGYQAAILARLAHRVYTIEIVPALAEGAAARLKRLGYENVTTRAGDGYHGWEEAAPFDGIIVTAAASEIPPPLVHQLNPGGRMVIPLGAPSVVQQLVLIERNLEDGRVTTRQLVPVSFVPLTSDSSRR
jgi:protein-L-isoaspartate(D-aspartate) O-methyltransferase